MKKLIIIFLLIVFSLSCKSDNFPINYQSFNEYLKSHYNKSLENGLYVIISNYGCGNCAKSIIHQLNKKKGDNSKIKIILLGVTSRELNQMGKTLNTYTIFKGKFTDFYNIFKINEMYPFLIEVKGSQIINELSSNPENTNESLSLIASCQK